MSSLARILPFLGDLQPLLLDDTITEVMVNDGGRSVFVERAGRLVFMPGLTIDEKSLGIALKQIARACDDEISEEQPILDARLADGSRVAAMLPPCSVDGATLTIRRFTHRYTIADLCASGSLPPLACTLVRRGIDQQHNLVISGGTGSGKTTFLNALSAWIPGSNRIVLVEETAELYVTATNKLRFQARRARPAMGNERSVAAVTIAELLRATLRHRPDRIIVGEIRGAEAFDLLQALNTGHRGSLTTIHGNSATDALARLAHCVLMAGTGLDLHAIREAIALAVQLVVHLDRVDGRRMVTEVLRLHGYDVRTDQFEIESLFRAPTPDVVDLPVLS